MAEDIPEDIIKNMMGMVEREQKKDIWNTNVGITMALLEIALKHKKKPLDVVKMFHTIYGKINLVDIKTQIKR